MTGLARKAAMLTRERISELWPLLNKRLAARGVQGELYLVGGAVMALAFNARPSTKDVDAYFKPPVVIREIATELAAEANLDADWLNDAVQGYLSARGDFQSFLELSHLKVFIATPAYLLAMKFLAMRLGAEFHDEGDVRFLLRYINITSVAQALKVITEYYQVEQFPQKTLYALEELLG